MNITKGMKVDVYYDGKKDYEATFLQVVNNSEVLIKRQDDSISVVPINIIRVYNESIKQVFFEQEYFDKWERLHDKPCKDGEPSSNNAWTYLAYSFRVGMIKEMKRVTRGCLDICWKNKTRHIENNNVPFLSRDEVIAMAFLDKKISKELIETDWWMCNKPQEFNLIDFIEQLFLLVKHRTDRNFWWKNNLDQMMYLTMKLPIVDRCFVYKCADIKAPWYYRLIEWIDKKKKPNGRSSRAIRSFKYNQDNFEGIMLYFNLEHPLRKYLEEKRKC